MNKCATIVFLAGEDLQKGDRVYFDAVRGKLYRAHDSCYLTLLYRDYKMGEVVSMPWAGGW